MVVAVGGAHVVAVADGGLDAAAAVVAGGQWSVCVAVAAAGG